MKTGRVLLLALGVLTVNASYLYAFESPSLFYVANVLLHLGLGVALLLAAVVTFRGQFPYFSAVGKITSLALLGAGLSGLALVVTGASRPFHWLLSLHILLAIVGLLLLITRLGLKTAELKILAAVILFALLFPQAVGGWRRLNPVSSDSVRNPVLVPTSMDQESPEGAEGPFFPSAATTDIGKPIPSKFFMDPEGCGKSGCHPDIYAQWKSSAHHLSSFNNQWYRKSIEYMQDVLGPQPSKWCGGCHDHAVFFNGMMDQPVSEFINRPESRVGLTCTSCHSIVEVRNTMGNGGFVIEYPPLHDLAASDNWFIEKAHDFVVHLDPGPHRKTFLKPFMAEQTAEFCSACHKVHLDVPVNNYRWFRGFNEYDGWQSSGVSGQGGRSFYYPPRPMDCSDCHMPLVKSDDAGNTEGYVHNHRFPGANSALPVSHQDDEQLELVQSFLKDNQVSVDIFAISPATEDQSDESHRVPGEDNLQVTSGFAEGDTLGFAVGRATGYTQARQILAPLDRVQPIVRRGDTVRVDVVVRTLHVGHFFPGGTVDAFDVWVELKAVDERGKTIFWSGYVPEDEAGRKGPVDSGAHFYRSFMLDEKGNPINKRNAWAARSVLYVRLIPPGAADTVHFRLKVPEDSGEKIFLTAKINYRKFSWWNTQWAFAGVRHPDEPNPEVGPGYDSGKWVFEGDLSDVSATIKEIPEVPIVTMAEAEAQLEVLDPDVESPERTSTYEAADLFRWNDYGIGLLLQGDLKAAEEIFLRVTQIDPDYADGWVNVGRVRVQEGRTDEAQEVLLKALEVDPDLASAHFFLAMTYKTRGKYDDALKHLRASEERYPRDRVVLNQIGRIFFLQREFSKAVETFQQVLRIDPEDLQAHYNLMLCYRGLGNQELAAREQKIYMRYKADESSQAITGPYRREHPEDNNERQAIHEHVSYPLEKIVISTPAVPVAAGSD